MADDDAPISVGFATLSEVSSEIESILAELTERLDTLHGRVAKVVATWEGEAREACVDSLDAWERSVNDIQAAQRWLHEVVSTGHVNYDGAHQAVLRGWSGA